MSAIFDPSSLPAGSQWIADDYSKILEMVSTGHSPYLYIIKIVIALYHPKVDWGFRTQLGIANGLFGLSIVIILVGLAIRVSSGRFWIFHRLDSTIVIPNTSVMYGLCSLAYSALGMVLVVCAVRISKNEEIPRYYVGARAAWIGPLFTGIYCEVWATLCGWYIRKKGAFYKESLPKTILAIVLPFLIPFLAWAAPTVLFYLAASNYNTSCRIGNDIIDSLREWQVDWTPEKGLETDKLLQLFAPGAELGDHLIAYTDQSRIGYAVCAAILLATLIAYAVGSILEIRHLGATIAQLRAKTYEENGFPPPRSSTSAGRRASSSAKSLGSAICKVLSPSSSPSPPLPSSVISPSSLPPNLTNPLDEEHFGRPDGRTAAVQHPWTLLAWVRRNRIWSVACIFTLLAVNAALEIWQAATPLDLRYPSGQWQVQILASCWLNGILSTLVSLLLLFRSLDATSSPLLSSLRHHLPFLPFPPPVTPTARSLITTEPPRYLTYGAGGAVPLIERVATRTVQVEEEEGGENGEVKTVPVLLPQRQGTRVRTESEKGELGMGSVSESRPSTAGSSAK
ncbi:hypothetical protein JCM8547_001647 [Rhodosporidiobolus lusitaniae]